jgi:multiple sugar transport system substrate-binding protein
LQGADLTLFAQGLGAELAWKPEKGAKLQLMRWKRFVQAEEDAFLRSSPPSPRRPGPGHGGQRIARRRAAESVRRGQHRPGPGHFLGPYSLPHLFVAKCLDVTDVADYLGKKYGGWVPSAITYGKSGNRWIAIPVGIQRERHQLPPEHDREGGLQGDPEGHRGIHGADEGAEGEEHAGRHGPRAAPRATATHGSTGACGRSAATWSTPRTR